MKRCTRCVMPYTRPGIVIDDHGVCNACINYDKRKEIDWVEREKQLKELLEKTKSESKTWDCIIPVSGGKDSTFQVLTMLKYGMTPLCVCATTCDFTNIGRRNLDNLKSLGVDCIEFSTNPKIRRKLNKIGLQVVGDISYPEHLSIFTIPVVIAVKFGIKLLIWGENSQNEYGGPGESPQAIVLDKYWLDTYGGLLNLDINELGFSYKEILPYQYPTAEELESSGIKGIFLGQYLPWNGHANAMIAQAHGFETYGTRIERSLVDYENLDNYQTGIHDYFKYIKYGFGRATDQAALQVRRGMMDRDTALKLSQEYDAEELKTYLGKPTDLILEEIGVTHDQFMNCIKFFHKNGKYQGELWTNI